jgi:hypothetical protein
MAAAALGRLAPAGFKTFILNERVVPPAPVGFGRAND